MSLVFLTYIFAEINVWLVLSLSKHQLSAALKRKSLSPDEKTVILDYANKMDCRKIAEYFSFGKIAASNILKDGRNLRKDFEFFKGNYQKRRHVKYHVVNEILYNWYGKCTSANIYREKPFFKKKLWRSKEDWTKKNPLVLQLRMEG